MVKYRQHSDSMMAADIIRRAMFTSPLVGVGLIADSFHEQDVKTFAIGVGFVALSPILVPLGAACFIPLVWDKIMDTEVTFEKPCELCLERRDITNQLNGLFRRPFSWSADTQKRELLSNRLDELVECTHDRATPRPELPAIPVDNPEA
jgi:hypothetical protein